MKYLIIGSGGREHAIAWKLKDENSSSEVYVAPGNGGIEKKFCVDIKIDDFQGIEKFCIDEKIDMVIVGPEAPLVAGLVDYLTDKNIPAFGPSKEAAMLEGSKLFAKSIMEKYGIPTAGYAEFTDKKKLIEYVKAIKEYPIVIKLDGLAAGKGVGIPENLSEALKFIDDVVKNGVKVFVEDFLEGEEASVLGISDGENIISLIAAQDHKRIFDGDRGPNTGGMGAYAPAPVMTEEILARVQKLVMQPTVDGMKKEGIPFKGILYAGIIIKDDDIKVLEYNVRFGDPEVQVILPLLENSLGDIFKASIDGTLGSDPFKFKKSHAITVVMSSGGYPGSYANGIEINGLDKVSDDIIVFHAGTKRDGDKIKTNGGRVLNVTSYGDSLEEARENVYSQIDKIYFKGSFYRMDIAHRALNR